MTTISKLKKRDDRSSFTCGDDDLDRFFRRQAGQHQFKRRASVTYVAIEDDAIAGFVTVCPGTLTRGDLGPAFKNYPPFPLPVLLLARLGVSTTMQGQGVGGLLLRHALTLAAGAMMPMAGGPRSCANRRVAPDPCTTADACTDVGPCLSLSSGALGDRLHKMHDATANS